MKPDISGRHGQVQVVPPLRVLVHVAAENLGLEMVDILVVEPHGAVVRVGHGVGGDEAFAITLPFGHEAGDLCRRPKVKL